MIIGLTGGIASGKSTVSGMLEDLGAVIIDADKIARQIVEPHQPVWRELRKLFGEDIFFADGTLNRKKLGAIIFTDEEKRQQLNQLMHPAIRAEMIQLRDEAEAEGRELIVLDIPLLFESQLEHMVEKILVVYVSEQVQRERLIARDKVDEGEAQRKMSSQMSIELKKDKGHAYINNEGSRAETKKQLVDIIHEWSRE